MFWMKSFFCKVEFVYIYDTSGEIETTGIPIDSLPNIA